MPLKKKQPEPAAPPTTTYDRKPAQPKQSGGDLMYKYLQRPNPNNDPEIDKANRRMKALTDVMGGIGEFGNRLGESVRGSVGK